MTPRVPQAAYPQRLSRWAVWLAGLYLAAVLGVWSALHFGADMDALPTLFLFGPRWVVAVPLLVLVPLALAARSYRAGVLTGLAGVVVAGPITGGTVSPGRLVASDRPALTKLRVVTWNMGGVKAGPAFRQFLDQVNPDVVVLQEANGELDATSFPLGWSLSPGGGQRVASRFSVGQKARLTAEQLGAPGGVVLCTLAAPDGKIAIANIHLPTVRPGIQVALDSKFQSLAELRRVIATRTIASRTARAWLGTEVADLIVAGDFNMPAESHIYRADWSGFRNAFSEAGTGWGTTKQTSWFGIRIDHVLYSPPWECRKVWVGPAMGSDHRPVIADLARVDN